MSPLPTANIEITQFFRQWLETFAGYVREVDYASARLLFHPDVLAFGTHNDVISGIDQWVTTQWDNVWPKTTDFRSGSKPELTVGVGHVRSAPQTDISVTHGHARFGPEPKVRSLQPRKAKGFGHRPRHAPSVRFD